MIHDTVQSIATPPRKRNPKSYSNFANCSSIFLGVACWRTAWFTNLWLKINWAYGSRMRSKSNLIANSVIFGAWEANCRSWWDTLHESARIIRRCDFSDIIQLISIAAISCYDSSRWLHSRAVKHSEGGSSGKRKDLMWGSCSSGSSHKRIPSSRTASCSYSISPKLITLHREIPSRFPKTRLNSIFIAWYVAAVISTYLKCWKSSSR